MGAVTTGRDLQAGLVRLWFRHRQEIQRSVEEITTYAGATAHGTAVSDEAEVARRAAHRLAGTLGTFGLETGSQLAREIETMLDRRDPSAATDVARLAALAAELSDSIERFAPSGGAPEQGRRADRAIGPAAGRVVGVLGLTPTATREMAERAAPQQISVQLFDDAASLLDAVTELDAVLIDGDVVSIADLPGGTWPVEVTPLVALSSGRRLSDRVAATRYGARRYLQAPATADAMLASVQSLWSPSSRTGTVLAVDDDPLVLDTLRELFDDNVKVTAVDDHEQFWMALEQHAPDVVILDVDMPNVNGIELCKVMRADDRWLQTGIVFLTARGGAETVREVFAAGADDMVTKPIIGPELRARIASRLERTDLHRRLAETDGLTGLANRATAARSGAADRSGMALRAAALGGGDRPRPLQADQRRPWAPRRRRGAPPIRVGAPRRRRRDRGAVGWRGVRRRLRRDGGGHGQAPAPGRAQRLQCRGVRHRGGRYVLLLVQRRGRRAQQAMGCRRTARGGRRGAVPGEARGTGTDRGDP